MLEVCRVTAATRGPEVPWVEREKMVCLGNLAPMELMELTDTRNNTFYTEFSYLGLFYKVKVPFKNLNLLIDNYNGLSFFWHH